MTIASNSQRQLWRIRLYYFILTGAGGFILPFVGLFFQRQGLSGTEIGFIGMVSAVTGLIAAPVWGRWSDRATDVRRLLQTAFLGTAGIHIIISQQSAFLWLAALFFLGGILTAGIAPMSDAMTIRWINTNKTARYGSIRLWGSLGWAIVVLLSGWLIEKTNIVSAFYGYAFLMVASALVANLLEAPQKDNQTKQETRPKLNTRAYLAHIIKDRSLVGLAIAMAIIWMTRTGIFQFQAIYLDQLGARESLIGFNSMIGSIIELPAMLIADRMINLKGSYRVLVGMMLLYALMNALVVISPTIAMIIAGSAIGGIGFSFYSVGIVVFLTERAPFGQTATLLAIYMSTLRGLISMIASPAAGLVFDFLGAYWLYILGLLGSLIGFAVFILIVKGERSIKKSAA